MVYDCFAFFNELDILEIRLNELDTVVDKFVIVEATRTFQKNPKPLIFEENKNRFEKFLPKIVHIVVDKYPGFFAKFRDPSPRDYDNYQKEFILKGLRDARDNDIVIVSDVDEIPDPKKVIEFKSTPEIKVFEQQFFYYYLNCLSVKPGPLQEPDLWREPVMLYKKDIKTIRKVRTLRGKEGAGIIIVKEGGWHFSYMGGLGLIIKKIEALSHDEFNKDYYKDRERLQKLIDRGEDLFDRNVKYKYIEVDNSFPKYILNNLPKYPHLINNVSII